MTLTEEQIKQRDEAYEKWVSARSPTLRTRHNEVIHNHGFEAGLKAAFVAQPESKPAMIAPQDDRVLTLDRLKKAVQELGEKQND